MTNDLPKSRKEAKRIGSIKYFTGEPCKHGHIAARYTDSGTCQECLTKKPAPSVAVAQDQQILVPTKIRVSAENYKRVLDLAIDLTRIRYPSVRDRQIESKPGGKDAQGGLLLYTLNLHPQDGQVVASFAASLIPRVDVAQARSRILGAAMTLVEAATCLEPREYYR